MIRELILIRGLPGSGKTTLARRLSPHVFAADDYFMDDGSYQFDPKQLSSAHKNCLDRATNALINSYSAVVHNTFSMHWEIQPYRDLATRVGARFTVIDLFNAGCTDAELAARTVHGVPESTIQAMRERWEPGY